MPSEELFDEEEDEEDEEDDEEDADEGVNDKETKVDKKKTKVMKKFANNPFEPKNKLIIKGQNKTLDYGNIGYLTKSLQQIMQIDIKKYYEKYEEGEIYELGLKKGITAIMRRSLTKKFKNSFINTLEVISRKSIKQIVNLITVDKFISAQNGTLIKIFHDLNFNYEKINNQDVDKSKFMSYFVKIIYLTKIISL